MDSSGHEILLEGIAAARAGDSAEAQALLRRATELVPDNADAWVWRASVADGDADRKSYLEEALRLNPAHEEARRALARITEREGALTARVDEDEITYCAVHPDRETRLRCNRCGRLMCTDCAVRHPVGLRCRECVNETKSPIFRVERSSLLLAFAAALLIALPVGAIVLLFGRVLWFIFWLFIGGAIGAGIAGGVQRIVPRKRGLPMAVAVGLGILVGTLLAALAIGTFMLGAPQAAIGLLLQLHAILYLVLGIAGAVARMR